MEEEEEGMRGIRCFFERVRDAGAKNNFTPDLQLQPVLRQLACLFALYQLCESDAIPFAHFLSPADMKTMRTALGQLLGALRPNAVAIVDGLNFSDRELRSVLGRRDGHVYRALFEWAERSPMNRVEVSATFHRHLKPAMDERRKAFSDSDENGEERHSSKI